VVSDLVSRVNGDWFFFRATIGIAFKFRMAEVVNRYGYHVPDVVAAGVWETSTCGLPSIGSAAGLRAQSRFDPVVDLAPGGIGRTGTSARNNHCGSHAQHACLGSRLDPVRRRRSCFLVMPFWIYVQTGNEVESSKLIGTIYKLLLFVVLPIGTAQLVRFHRSSAAWATVHRVHLSRCALIGILAMVFLGAIKMGLRLGGETEASISAANLLIAATILLGIHTFVFWFGIVVARQLGLDRGSQIAVGFSGSQKTLMIGLSTAVNLGMNIIPIVMYHALQLIVDSIFAERIRDE
jgi:hypothetical protein